MTVKCIALDLDGTTLYDHDHLSDRTRNAIQRAIFQGVQIVVATGRCFEALPACVREIEGINYAITSNGAAIYDLNTETCIRRFSVPRQAVERILEITKDVYCTYEVFYHGKAYGQEDYIKAPWQYGISREGSAYIQKTRHSVPQIEFFLQEHSGDLDSLDILVPDQEKFAFLYDTVRKLTDIYVTTSVKCRIEISSWRAGKHTGVAHILTLGNLQPWESAAFGNGDNDGDMLRFVKYGFAVENATKNCLEAADYIVPSNEKDGVAQGIERLLRGEPYNL